VSCVNNELCAQNKKFIDEKPDFHSEKKFQNSEGVQKALKLVFGICQCHDKINNESLMCQFSFGLIIEKL
jgi:hypothetical protein